MKECKDSHIEEILAELRTDYIEALPATIDSLESFISQKNYSLAREEFHKLKGTGKTYGLDEVTQLGETMERICVEYSEHLAEFLPKAVHVLEKIYDSRRKGLRHPMEEDEDFLLINNYVALH